MAAARTAGRRALARLAAGRGAPLLSAALPQAEAAHALTAQLAGWSGAQVRLHRFKQRRRLQAPAAQSYQA
jgi:hypothetical protein